MPLRHIAIAAACAAAVVVTAIPAEAAPVVRIRQVYFDSPGKDNRSNKSLNGEWIQIGNYGTKARSLKGWKIKDKTGYTYTFGAYTLPGRKIVTIHTGSGKNTRYTLFWGRKAYVWNNDGDTAYLRSPSGKLIDSCSWDGTGDSKRC